MKFAQPWDKDYPVPRQESLAFGKDSSGRATGLADWLTMPPEQFEARHPLSSRPHASQLNRRLVRALLPVLRIQPSERELNDKPIELALQLPLPPALRFYAFAATQHSAERQTDTYKIQLTHVPRFPEGRRWKFSRESGVRPILIGYVPSLPVFILWDAYVNDAGEGFTYSKSVQAPPGLVYEALANGKAVGSRRVRGVGREWIVAVRRSRLVEGLALRIELSNRALIGVPGAQ